MFDVKCLTRKMSEKVRNERLTSVLHDLIKIFFCSHSAILNMS